MTRALAWVMCGLWATPLLASSPDPKDLAIPPEEISKARQLIHRLGSEVYREREEAQSELSKMGRFARPVLLEAASTDPDPEVRFRCSRLLPKAGADDLKARLETFLADADGKYEHNLPGLKQFLKIVGQEKAARDLFVEMIKSPFNAELLQMLEKGNAEAGRAISDRRMSMWSVIQKQNMGGRIQPQAQAQLPLVDIACLIFAETVIPAKDIPRTNMWNYVSGVTFLQQPASITAINNGGSPQSGTYKVILGKWLESRDDMMELNQLAYPVGNILRGLKESVPTLRRIITTEGVAGYAKGQALMYLVQQRGNEERELLRKLLNDNTVVTSVFFGVNGPNQVPMQHQCLLRDVALAMLITQSKQKMSDYGYLFPPGFVQNGAQIGYGNYAFPTEEARNNALIKFGFWRMKQAGMEKDLAAAPAAKDAPPAEKK